MNFVVVEVRTVDNPGLDQAQIRTIALYEDQNSFYLGCDWIDPLSDAIAHAILRLGSNYRHPLYFRVEVIPRRGKTPRRKRRLRKNRKHTK